MGLPCARIIQERLLANGELQPDDFHLHWRLDRLAALPPIDPTLLLRDPVKIRAWGKDDGKRQPRQLSRVEHVRQETAVAACHL